MSGGPISHTAILASAGSGKTFQLAHRYIRLLAAGASPDQVAALTFSRKAAGEIFESVVRYLSDAAESPDKAGVTAEIAGIPRARPALFLGLLRRFLEDLHQAHIGTLDSFIVGILRAFPLELGIGTDLQLMDNEGADASLLRREMLGRLFRSRSLAPAVRTRFLDAFRLATFGHEEKGLDRVLGEFITGFRHQYLLMPDAAAWGAESRIWPDGCPWKTNPRAVESAAAALRDFVAKSDWPDSCRKRWLTFIDAAEQYSFTSPWPRGIEYMLEKLLPEADALRKGGASIGIERRECELTREAGRHAWTLVSHVMAIELHRAMQQTAGLHEVLAQYEQLYDGARRAGRLTFTDAQHLLSPDSFAGAGHALSRAAGIEGRLYIDYRLDARLNHWLIDEFQDTSDLQWQVLSNLADEVIQDTSGERSFFFVGDVKQAIYGWRGGNARLFAALLDRYAPSIEKSNLSVSYRSSQPVIDTVNAVFSPLPDDFPAAARESWGLFWQKHKPAEGHVPATGYAAIVEPPYDGTEKPGEEEIRGVVAGILNAIDPAARGLSAAVLVRSNEAGRRIVQFLRQACPSMTIVHEGRANILDHPLVALLLSLVKYAFHPGDTLAMRHLQMSALHKALAECGDYSSTLPLCLLREIRGEGFQPFLRRWAERFMPAEAKPFERKRLQDLLGAAGEFDAAGNGDCDAFIAFVEQYTVQDLAASSSIRVMTIHQAKGLEFDLVILPELMGSSMTAGSGPDFLTDREAVFDSPQWGLKTPRKLVTEADPVLADAFHRHTADESFESLCVLYVAMTRARSALYMVTAYPGNSATAMNPAALLKQKLTGGMKTLTGRKVDLAGVQANYLYEKGDADWFAASPRRPASRGKKKEIEAAALPLPAAARMRRIEPSRRDGFERRVASLFDVETREVLDFGTAIHHLLEQVEWIDAADPEAIIAAWLRESADSPAVQRDVTVQFRRCLQVETVRNALARPSGPHRLWREKHFEIVLDGALVSGQFDRVLIVEDKAGRPVKASVLDYKSNRIATDVEFDRTVSHYREQMALYGRALSVILHLPPEAIRLQLLFTRAAVVRDVPVK